MYYVADTKLKIWAQDSAFQRALMYEVLLAQSWPTLCHPTGWAHQVSLSMGFSRQEYYSGLPFPSRGPSPPRDWTCHSCLSGKFFTIWATMETQLALRDWSEEVGEEPLFFFFGNKDQVVKTSKDYHSIKKTRLLKLMDLRVSLCMGRCKSLGLLKSFLWYEP